MPKPVVTLKPSTKRRRFGQVNRAMFDVALFAVEHAGKWVRVENMNKATAMRVHVGTPRAFEPDGAYLGRFRDGKAYVKFVGTLGSAIDEHDRERRNVVVSSDGKRTALYPSHGKLIAARVAEQVRESLEKIG